MNTIAEFLSHFDHPDLLIKILLLAIPLYVWIGTWFFDGFEDFLDSLRLLFQPSWLSAFRGEAQDDMWSELRFLFYVLMCAAFVTGMYKLSIKYFYSA